MKYTKIYPQQFSWNLSYYFGKLRLRVVLIQGKDLGLMYIWSHITTVMTSQMRKLHWRQFNTSDTGIKMSYSDYIDTLWHLAYLTQVEINEEWEGE